VPIPGSIWRLSGLPWLLLLAAVLLLAAAFELMVLLAAAAAKSSPLQPSEHVNIFNRSNLRGTHTLACNSKSKHVSKLKIRNVQNNSIHSTDRNASQSSFSSIKSQHVQFIHHTTG
jgi:hypothetical protein